MSSMASLVATVIYDKAFPDCADGDGKVNPARYGEFANKDPFFFREMLKKIAQ